MSSLSFVSFLYGIDWSSVGYLVQLKGWRTAFQLMAAINLAIFVAHIFLGPETLFPDRDKKEEEVKLSPSKGRWRQYIHFGILDHSPLRLIEFIHPFFMVVRPVILLPAVAYGMVFAYTNALVVRGSSELYDSRLNYLLA